MPRDAALDWVATAIALEGYQFLGNGPELSQATAPKTNDLLGTHRAVQPGMVMGAARRAKQRPPRDQHPLLFRLPSAAYSP